MTVELLYISYLASACIMYCYKINYYCNPAHT